jgi:tyrosine-protein kinase Etk/Wzc
MTNNLDIFALLKSIVRHRKFIIYFVIIVSIAAVCFAMLYPKHWQSNAVIATSSNSAAFPGVLKSLISSYSPGLENMAGNTEADLQGEILLSRDFSEAAVRKFNLMKYFKYTQKEWAKDSLDVMDNCILKLQGKVMSISVKEVTGTIGISALTKDKVLSRNLVNFYVEELDKYNREVRISKGREKRVFLEKRILQIEQEIDKESAELAAFQQKNHLINLEEQVTAAIAAFSEIIKQKVQTATELEFILSYMSKDNPKALEYQKRLESINSQIDKMQSDNFSQYIPNFDDVNALTLVYLKKKMKIEISTQIYETLLPQYELAKLEEINDLTSIQYIQRATLDGIREKPKRAMICIIAFMFAVLFSCLASFLYDLLASQKSRFKEILNSH